MSLRRSRRLGVRQLVALTIVFGVGISQVILAVADWRLDDWEIYRAAADRILAGEPLYSEGRALDSYRYAPWLAYAAIPFSGPVWSTMMLLGSLLALAPLAQQWRQPEALLLLGVFGPNLFYLSSSGNIQGPMLAALVWSLQSRWAFLGIGLAASLKITPILFVLVLVAERRWRQVGASVLLTALLWLPVSWMTVSPETLSPGAAQLLPLPVWLMTATSVAAGAGLLAWRRSPLTGLGAAVGAIAALPRFFLYDVTLLLVACRPSRLTGHPVVAEGERAAS